MLVQLDRMKKEYDGFSLETEYGDSRESGDRIDRGEWSGKEYDI